MNFKLTLFVIALLAAFAVAPQAQAQRNVYTPDSSDNIRDRDRGPAFSSPQEYRTWTGDLESHYPPYYRDEGGGSK